jgi:hypothetical protein
MATHVVSDAKFMANPFLWPLMVLPIKRYPKDLQTGGHRMETAYMVGDGPRIYHGNIFDPKPSDRREDFESFEAIVAAGWVVD